MIFIISIEIIEIRNVHRLNILYYIDSDRFSNYFDILELGKNILILYLKVLLLK